MFYKNVKYNPPISNRRHTGLQCVSVCPLSTLAALPVSPTQKLSPSTISPHDPLFKQSEMYGSRELFLN